MATSKEAIQSDPLAMLASLIGNVAKGASQGTYQDPNTGARNYSVLQGGAGALAGAGESMLAMKEFKLKEDVMKQQMDMQERQMKIAEQQNKQQQAAFARDQEARNLELDQRAKAEQEKMLASGYGSSTTGPATKYTGKRNPKTGEMEKTQEQLTHEWGQANQGKPLPTSQLQDSKTERKGPLDFLPFGLEKGLAKQFLGKDVTTSTPVAFPIVPGTGQNGEVPKMALQAVHDVDHMKRIGQAIATDPALNPLDRSRLMAEYKGEMKRVAENQYRASSEIKQTLDTALQNKQITPDDYTKLMQLYLEMGARKNPELVHKANQFMVNAFQGNLQGMVSSFQDTMQSVFTRVNPWTDTMFRMGMPSTSSYAQTPAQMVQQGRPTYNAGKATKGKK